MVDHEIFIPIMEALGTLAFAISGIRLAAQKDFDLFGAYVVGLVTAIGGGTIRDLCLGLTPFWMLDASYLFWSAVALVIVIVLRKYLVRLNNTFFIFDTIGLALFTVVGIEKTIGCGYPFWVAIIMGTITGSAGGVMRDIFINQIPLIFRKEIYAIACIIGGLIYYLCDRWLGDIHIAEIASAGSVVLTRIIAVKYQIGLPKLKSENFTNK